MTMVVWQDMAWYGSRVVVWRPAMPILQEAGDGWRVLSVICALPLQPTSSSSSSPPSSPSPTPPPSSPSLVCILLIQKHKQSNNTSSYHSQRIIIIIVIIAVMMVMMMMMIIIIILIMLTMTRLLLLQLVAQEGNLTISGLRTFRTAMQSPVQDFPHCTLFTAVSSTLQ